MSSDNIITVNDKNFESIVLNSDIPVVVDFWAPWCGPCKAITPSIEELSNEWSEKKVEFVALDVDNAPDIATLYNVISVPTFIAFRNGQPVSEVRSMVNEPNIRRTFEKHIK